MAARQLRPGEVRTDDLDVLFRAHISREFVLRVDGWSSVESDHGWVTVHPMRLLYESNYLGFLVRSSTGRRSYTMTPNPLTYAMSRAFDRPLSLRLPTAISLLDILSTNYAHFFDLIMNKLRLAEEAGLPDSLPLLLSSWAASTPFCQAVLGLHPEIAKRVVVVKSGRVEVEQLFIVRNSMDAKDNYDFARRLVGQPATDGSERLLLIRRVGANGRKLANEPELIETCQRFGFQPYDPAVDSLQQQAKRFANASHVVSVHGAALANTMFRAGAPMSILELFHSAVIRDHFFVLAAHYGFDYDALVGNVEGKPSKHAVNTAPLRIDVQALTRKLDRMTSCNS